MNKIKCKNCGRYYDYEGWEIDNKNNYIDFTQGNNYTRRRIKNYLPRTIKCKCGNLVILEKLSKEIKLNSDLK